jgi:hypothetical protein
MALPAIEPKARAACGHRGDIEERRMGPAKLIATAAVLASGSVLTAPHSGANYDEFAPNGTYSVVSNGEWAKMNDRYQDEPTVRSIWNVTSTCSTAFTCSGKVTSSLGWTEDIYTTSGTWYVKHYVPDWIPCPDGGTGPGLQVYIFFPATDEGIQHDNTNLYVGMDQTTGESGACGRNRSLVLNLPVKITKVS